MINYSVSPRINPRDKEAAPKYYATAQKTSTVTLDELSENISHATTATRADVLAVITAVIDEMMNELKKGNSIILGDVGTFRMTINSKGAETAEDFDVSLIKKASVRYYPSRRVKNIYSELEYKKVPSRKTVASALKGNTGNGGEEEEEGGEDLTA